MNKQKKQIEWFEEWSMIKDNELFLFKEWIYPNTLEDFKGKEVLECGCGSGQHTSFVAPYSKEVTSVDLNTIEIARERNKNNLNVKFIEEDIGTMDLKKQYDIVFSIGVVHHTDNPDLTFENLKRHVKSGGRLIVWVYSREGNFFAEKIVEPIRKHMFYKLKRKTLLTICKFITAAVYIPVYSIYLLPLKFLPYYEYFCNFRKLSFIRNAGNTFDHLNAPQVDFISRERIEKWFSNDEFENICFNHYKKVSWSASGTKK